MRLSFGQVQTPLSLIIKFRQNIHSIYNSCLKLGMVYPIQRAHACCKYSTYRTCTAVLKLLSHQCSTKFRFKGTSNCKINILYDFLTISHLSLGDYKPILIKPKAKWIYRLVITEPEATNCFNINFQVFTYNNQLNIKINFKIIAV